MTNNNLDKARALAEKRRQEEDKKRKEAQKRKEREDREVDHLRDCCCKILRDFDNVETKRGRLVFNDVTNTLSIDGAVFAIVLDHVWFDNAVVIFEDKDDGKITSPMAVASVCYYNHSKRQDMRLYSATRFADFITRQVSEIL